MLKCENLKKSSQLKYLALSDNENDEILNIFSHLKQLKKDLDIDARVSGIVYKESEKFDFCMSTTIYRDK